MIRQPLRVSLVLLLATTLASAQSARRLTTVDAIRLFPGFYHLQNVLLRGEFSIDGARTMLRADDHEIRAVFDEGVSAPNGAVDVRGLVIDVGRLEPGDPRVGSIADGRDADRWPRPGEELVVRVSAAATTSPASGASVRAIAIEPWRFDGQTVTIVGNFRGRNLFGDLPGAPGRGRYDFVLRGTEGALWVTDIRPRGQGFDLDVNRRVDTDRWIEVTGTVVRDKGLISLKATRVALAKAPDVTEAAEEAEPPPIPVLPVEVVFNSPTEGETDVPGAAPIRVQFSRGLNEASLEGRVRVTYLGQPAAEATVAARTTYDAANRAIQIAPVQPLEPYRTVRIELLDGITAFDGAPVTPWMLTYSVGG